MTRYGIDPLTAIRLSRESLNVHESHQLVAPNRLPSDAMALLYRSVQAGELESSEARRIIDGMTTMGIRLLGDRVSRATAWRIAERRQLADTYPAEYIAVAQLQADALITLDEQLRVAADGIVPISGFDALLSP